MSEVILTYKGNNEFSIVGNSINQNGYATKVEINRWFGNPNPKIGVKIKGIYYPKDRQFITEKDFWNRQARSLSGIDFDCKTGLG